MLYTYILDDSIESPTLFLTADHLGSITSRCSGKWARTDRTRETAEIEPTDHSTLLFLPSFLPNKELPFFLWVSLYMINDQCDPPSVSTSLPPC